MKKLLLLVALSSIIISAVAQSRKKIEKVLQSWVNSNKKELYQSWGPPNRVTSDGGTGEILIYTNRVYARGYNIGGVQGNPIDYNLTKMLYVNSEGVIYNWRWEKTQNAPQNIDVNGAVIVR